MKWINVAFENEEMEKLMKAKGDQSWHDFIMKLVKKNERTRNEPED